MIEPTEAQITAFLRARCTRDDAVPGYVFDEISECLDDNEYRELVGVGPASGNPQLRTGEGREYQRAIVLAGLRAVLNLKTA
jgi:hypothetical protein